MALTKVQADGINLGDTFAFTGDVSGAGLSSPIPTNTTITGENGGGITTNICQGVAKAWASISLDDTIMDNLNASSFTDNGTGTITHTFGNPMANKNYSCVTNNLRNASNGYGHSSPLGSNSDSGMTLVTSGVKVVYFNASNTAEDPRRGLMTSHGDLA